MDTVIGAAGPDRTVTIDGETRVIAPDPWRGNIPGGYSGAYDTEIIPVPDGMSLPPGARTVTMDDGRTGVEVINEVTIIDQRPVPAGTIKVLTGQDAVDALTGPYNQPVVGTDGNTYTPVPENVRADIRLSGHGITEVDVPAGTNLPSDAEIVKTNENGSIRIKVVDPAIAEVHIIEEPPPPPTPGSGPVAPPLGPVAPSSGPVTPPPDPAPHPVTDLIDVRPPGSDPVDVSGPTTEPVDVSGETTDSTASSETATPAAAAAPEEFLLPAGIQDSLNQDRTILNPREMTYATEDGTLAPYMSGEGKLSLPSTPPAGMTSTVDQALYTLARPLVDGLDVVIEDQAIVIGDPGGGIFSASATIEVSATPDGTLGVTVNASGPLSFAESNLQARADAYVQAINDYLSDSGRQVTGVDLSGGEIKIETAPR